MKKLFLSLIACNIAVFSASTLTLPDVSNPPKTYPKGVLGEYVKLGEQIILHTDTHPLSKDLVGNTLKCTDCHINGGKTKSLGTFIGTSTSFPAYSDREKTVQTLEDRINNCFMRSMNGTRPINGTKVSLAMASYVAWLSEGLPQKMNPKKPVTPYYTNLWTNKDVAPLIKKATHENYVRGQKLYEEKCAVCHQKNGAGIPSAFPPLWGKNAYNAGAGMSKLNKMSSWIMYNMPQGSERTLSAQEAADITIYVDAQEHPDFDLQKHLPKNIGHYNSEVLKETHSVETNFKAFGLDLKTIMGK